jgi:FtsH-binding integral membrane protein
MDLSSISAMNKSTYEERKYNLSFLKSLYSLYALKMIITWLWSLLLVSYPDTFSWVVTAWYVALITGIIALGILAFTMVSPKAKEAPLNLVCYALFTLFFAYTIGFFCLWDTSRLFFFCLTILTVISIGFALYHQYLAL